MRTSRYALHVPSAGLTRQTYDKLVTCVTSDAKPHATSFGRNEVFIEIYDRPLGLIATIHADILAVLHEADKDRPFELAEGPSDVALGTVIRHAPGLDPDFTGQCDTEDRPHIDGADLLEIAAITDPHHAHARLRAALGADHIDAYDAATQHPAAQEAGTA